jgi:hypothetical protein
LLRLTILLSDQEVNGITGHGTRSLLFTAWSGSP